jgi:hypothetical protein
MAGFIDCDKGLNRNRRSHNLELPGDNHKERCRAVSLLIEYFAATIERMCPRAVMRLTCAGVNLGNICSIRELVIGNPLRVFDIVVIYSVVAPHKSSLGSFRLSISEKEYPKMMRILRDFFCKKISGKKREIWHPLILVRLFFEYLLKLPTYFFSHWG